jgi:IclR family transcriptional regulator, acetate operon repressor
VLLTVIVTRVTMQGMRSGEWAEGSNSVLGRAVRLLSAFDAEHSVLGTAELARRSGVPKTTAHRLVGELTSLGLLEQTPGGARLGLRLFELGQLVPRQRTLREAALPIMENLRDATRTPVHLAVLDDVEVVYVEILGGRAMPRLPSRVGGRMPAHATGVGKAMLAFAPPELVQRRLDAGLSRRTPHTIVAPSALLRELASIRDRGVAYDREEGTLGVVCVAAPVTGPDGAVDAAISVSGRAETLDLERMAPAVRTAALTLSQQARLLPDEAVPPLPSPRRADLPRRKERLPRHG